MTYFNPQTAPRCHIEALPSNACAATAQVLNKHTQKNGPRETNFQNCIEITTWAPRESGLLARDSGDLDDFYENHCDGCEYNTDCIEVDLSYHDVEISHSEYGDLYLYGGTGYASSPCPCYDDGIGSVEFPCAQGHEPDVDDEREENLSGDYLTYGIILTSDGSKKIDDFVYQQGIRRIDDTFYVSDRERAINTFDSNIQRVCWGGNSDPRSLIMIEQVFSQSFANQDLLSYESHESNADLIKEQLDDYEDDMIVEEWRAKSGVHNISYDGRPIGLAVATSVEHTGAFVLMTVSGAVNTNGCCSVPVSLYRDVNVEGNIIDVWVSDEMPVGCKLMFYNGHFLGQIPITFDLQSCKSHNAQSSDAEELAKA